MRRATTDGGFGPGGVLRGGVERAGRRPIRVRPDNGGNVPVCVGRSRSRGRPSLSPAGPGSDTGATGGETIMFETLAHLHDTLSLPTPQHSRAALADQIFDLQQQINITRQEAAMADAVGLPTHRLVRELVWGEQCMNALLEAWDDSSGAASA